MTQKVEHEEEQSSKTCTLLCIDMFILILKYPEQEGGLRLPPELDGISGPWAALVHSLQELAQGQVRTLRGHGA